MKDWKINSIEIIGKSHIPDNIPCQDKTHYVTENNITVMALSDGCGSSKLSHIGADITVKALCKLISTEFESILAMSPLESRKYVIDYVVNELQKYVDDNEEVHIKDLNATFLFVGVDDDNTAIMGHIGDGYIGAVQNNELVIKSLEKKTGEVNGTVYPTTTNSFAFLDLRRGSVEDVDAFVLMSDGTGDGLVDSRTPFVKTFSNGVAGIIEHVGSHTYDENQQLLESYITKVRDHINSKDDCSIAVMTIENISIKPDGIIPYKLDKPKPKEETVVEVDIDEVIVTEPEENIVHKINDYLIEAFNEIYIEVPSDSILEGLIELIKKAKPLSEIAEEINLDEDVVQLTKHILYEHGKL